MDKKINKLLAKAGIQVKKTSALEDERKYLTNTICCLQELYTYRFHNNKRSFNNEILGVVFSKNRAMQLQALLHSYFHYAKSPAPLKVIYAFSAGTHEVSYKILREEFSRFPVEFIRENNFENDLQMLTQQTSADRIFFMTDDAVFTGHFDLADVLQCNPLNEIFSLRLGKDMTYSFAYNKEQSLPVFKNNVFGNSEMYSWVWADMQNSPDWYYPLSVDATLFCTDEINIMLKYIGSKNPNSFEANLQLLSSVFLPRKGICYERAKYVNIPCNVVQQDFKNIYTGAFDVEELLKLFMEGKRINWSVYNDGHPKEIQHSRYIFN